MRLLRQATWSDHGLTIGADTHLVEAGQAIVHERLVALLTAAHGGAVDDDVLDHIEAARRFWMRGDLALAQLRLVYAPLPEVDDAGAFRAFLAERALAAGASLPAVWTALGLRAESFLEK